MAAAVASPKNGGSARFSIGQVIDLLSDEFPGLKHSKLHFLEERGLITPQRTPAGYRKYSREDVDRLLFILRAQRDWFWPLDTIKEHLEQQASGDAKVISIAKTPVRLDRAGLLRQANISEQLFAELCEYRFLDPDATSYFAADVELAKAAQLLADEGLHPRHLVLVRSAASRQAHLVKSATLPKESARKGADHDLAGNLAEAVLTVHAHVLRAEVR